MQKSIIFNLLGKINFTEFGIMAELSARPLTGVDLCEALGITARGLAPYISRLKRNGYLISKRQPRGHRVDYILTPQGEQTLRDIRESIKIKK